MPFVVCEPCIKCKYRDCVDVCPVGCFHEGESMLVIDPDECIDCGVCMDECPSAAIHPLDEVPDHWQEFIEINATYSQKWPAIHEGKDPLPDADTYRDMEGKRQFFSKEPGEGN